MGFEIVKGTVARAQKVCVYGPEGVGKTSFAAKFPKPLFLDLERGSCAYEVDRVYPETVAQVEEVLDRVIAGGSGYETVVIDTYDALWQLYARQVAALKGVKSVEDVAYGAGVKLVADYLVRLLVGRVEGLIAAGVNVVVLAHTAVQKHDDPATGASYDRFQFRVQRLSAHALMEKMDSVLFANFDTKVVQEVGGKVRAVGGRERVLSGCRTAGYDGKSRFVLPEKLGMTEASVVQILNGKTSEAHPWDGFLKEFSEEQIANFLRASGYLSEGQGWREVTGEIVARGVKQPDRLRAAIEAHGAKCGESDTV